MLRESNLPTQEQVDTCKTNIKEIAPQEKKYYRYDCYTVPKHLQILKGGLLYK